MHQRLKKILFSTFFISTFTAFVIFNRGRIQNGQLVASAGVLDTQAIPASSPSTNSFDHTQPPPPHDQQPPQPVPTTSGRYRDGQFTGSIVDAYYGNVQVQAVIRGGQLRNVLVLDYPNDTNHSRMLNQSALPRLVSEAIQSQNANVNVVSGATETSKGFQQSLNVALAQANP